MKWRGPQRVSMRQAYRYYTQKRPKQQEYVLKEEEFSKILRGVCQLIGDYLLEGNLVTLPFKLGVLGVEVTKHKSYFDEEGKFVNTAPVHWGNTNKLWDSDPEAKANKVLIRCENTNIYYLKYYKSKARFHNRKFISFKTCRTMRAKMVKLAQTNNLQALTIKRWQ